MGDYRAGAWLVLRLHAAVCVGRCERVSSRHARLAVHPRCCREAKVQVSHQELAAGSARSEVDDMAMSLRSREVEQAHLHQERATLKAQVTSSSTRGDE